MPAAIAIQFKKDTLHFSFDDEVHTVHHLKEWIQTKTSVQIHRQKILGLPKNANQATWLKDVNHRKLMLVGTPEADITNAIQQHHQGIHDAKHTVADDLDVDLDERVTNSLIQENQHKIAQRVAEYTPKMLHPPRTRKRLLVLDVDYTLFDHRSVKFISHHFLL